LLVTVPGVAVKVAVVAPAATVTEAGTVKAALFEDRPTETPPVGAADDKLTVQPEVAPAATELGEHDTPEIAGELGAPAEVISIALMVGFCTTGITDIAICPPVTVTL
jgi:hypothetical protein